MPLRAIANPPNPFSSTELEYLEGQVPDARLRVMEDSSRTILSKNDSPDVGFTWSVNPYRGCWHACAYCLDGDSPILMGDGRVKPMRLVAVGDVVYGTERRGAYRRYVRTPVLAHWRTVKPAFRVALANGAELMASADHRFLTQRGWKYVTGAEQGRARRPFLNAGNRLMGTGRFAVSEPQGPDYVRGYLCGMIRGDALLRTYRYERPGRAHGDIHTFRLALVDLEPLRRSRSFLQDVGVPTSDEFVFQAARAGYREVRAIRTNVRTSVEHLSRTIEWPCEPSRAWSAGFLSGIFDAEGSYSRGILRISNTNSEILSATTDAFRRLGFETAIDEPSGNSVASSVRLRGGLAAHLRFFHGVDPATTRKRDIEGVALKHGSTEQRVVAVEPLGFDLLMADMTTGTGDFIADGVVSHNCYARPSHEYLGLGAGTDFDRTIVVKPEAPALLREAFEKRSWRGETVVFSGVTDCYQPLEASYRLTRQCLEVCAEYKNPVAIITKAPLVERDLDVLVRLTERAQVEVAVSVPIWDPVTARLIEPGVATPERRIRAIARLAAAGVAVRVMVAPVIPGLNDEDIGDVLAAASAAGATSAGFVLVRLPGSVAAVFEERVRAALPLRAERILRRIREARGGKMYDARFGVRGRGEGPYADAIGALFARMAARHGLAAEGMGGTVETPTTFARPASASPSNRRQLPLF